MSNFIETYFKNVPPLRDEFIESTLQTLYMAGVTALIAGVLGIILGVILVVTDQGGILENKYLYSVLDKIINIFRYNFFYKINNIANFNNILF